MIGQQHAMSGQISAAWNIFVSIPTVAALLIGGISAVCSKAGTPIKPPACCFWSAPRSWPRWPFMPRGSPKRVRQCPRRTRGRRASAGGSQTAGRHWPIYPALLIWLLWNFAPGSATPLQYYLQNTLHAEDAQWGQWNAIFAASFIPTFMVFGFLCQRSPLRTLLLWGTVVAIPQMVPLLFIHSVTGALIAAVPIGLMGGVATAAYLDLIIRSCPRACRARR